MKTKEELRNFYEKELKSDISSLEDYRSKTIKERLKVAISTIICIGLFVLLTWLKDIVYFEGKSALYWWLVIFLFSVWAVVFSQAVSMRQNYQRHFKRNVMKKLVAYINSNYSYSPNQSVSGLDYLNSRLTHTSCDVYNGEDYVSGAIDKTPFGFSEVVVRAIRWKKYKSYEENLKWINELERRKKIYNSFLQQSEDAKGDIEGAQVGDIGVGLKKMLQVYTKVFKGLFFVAEFNKNLNENTFVVPEKEYANLLGQEKTKVAHYGELVKLENPEFEKIFSVYGSSQQEARYVLTPTMMEAIVNLSKTYNLKMKFSFRGAKVYCAIPMKKDMFEPTVKRGIKYEDIEEFYMILSLIETIITEMNLNTRIWTKE